MPTYKLIYEITQESTDTEQIIYTFKAIDIKPIDIDERKIQKMIRELTLEVNHQLAEKDLDLSISQGISQAKEMIYKDELM